MNQITFDQINNDSSGNPRYVCHFLVFIKDNEDISLNNKYAVALARAKKLGGRKFHNKQYGGGIVFQTYNTVNLNKRIHELLNSL